MQLRYSVFLDPRNSDLGARLIINLEKLYLSLKKLELKDDNTLVSLDESVKSTSDIHNEGLKQFHEQMIELGQVIISNPYSLLDITTAK